MKKMILLFIVIAGLTLSCKKEQAAPPVQPEPKVTYQVEVTYTDGATEISDTKKLNF